MSSQTLTIALLLIFPLLVSVHVATLFGLARQRQFGAAVAGLFVPPVAPYCAFVRGMRFRAIAWVVAAVLYVVVYLLAR